MPPNGKARRRGMPEHGMDKNEDEEEGDNNDGQDEENDQSEDGMEDDGKRITRTEKAMAGRRTRNPPWARKRGGSMKMTSKMHYEDGVQGDDEINNNNAYIPWTATKMAAVAAATILDAMLLQQQIMLRLYN
ncbi:hypothetical protein DFH27DRAFT_616616 [Peziza echinospora]|nr:hypothetical protein DFH27DRAFT_616616 [Peziza echinospora]